MLGLNKKDFGTFLLLAILVVLAPRRFPISGLAQFNAGYPDLMQLRDLWYLCDWLQHSIWSYGLPFLWSRCISGCGLLCGGLDDETCDHECDPCPYSGVIGRSLHLALGWISLRRSGIYFSILTLAFAQMCLTISPIRF